MANKQRIRGVRWQIGRFGVLLGLTFAICASAGWVFEIEPFSIEPASPRASVDLPQDIVDYLRPEGSLLFTRANGLKMPICEVFWVKAAVTRDSPPGPGQPSYRALKPGALVGVIHFLPDASEDYREDFHDQKLRPGYYSMRYAVMPDGDTVDTLLLSPLNADHDPGRVLDPEELVHFSRKASRTKQPAVMSLVPVDLRGNDFPDIKTDGDGTWTLQVKLRLTSSKGDSGHDLAVAVVLVTPKKLEEGS